MPIGKSRRSTTIAIALAAAAATSLVPCQASAFFRMGGMGRGMSAFHQGGQAGTFGMWGARRAIGFQRWPRTAGYGIGNIRHPIPYPEGRGTGGHGGTGGWGEGTRFTPHTVHFHPSFASGMGGRDLAASVGPLSNNPTVGPLSNNPMSSAPNRSTRRGRSGVPPSDERRYVPDEIMTEMIGDPSDQAFRALGARHNLNRLNTQRVGLTNSTWVRWRIVGPRRSVPEVIRALEADNAARDTVLSAQPNYLYAAQQDRSAQAGNGGPTGQADDFLQYALAKLHIPEAQAMALGKRVVVAIIDTEIDRSHRELSGAVTDGFDALGIAAPMEAHGTGIAGIIAAHARLLGTAPAVRILAIRALGNSTGTTDTVMRGLDYAVAHDARVINMSFTGPADPALTRALAAAHARGRILVAAVGNRGPNSPALFPAADPNVIAVTATDIKDRLFAGANRGDHVAIAAPGVDILVPAPGNAYTMSTGTSFASAYVAGVAALLVERNPALTPDAVKNILMSTAHDLGPKGRDALYGAGLMDANQAILTVNGRPAAELMPMVTH